MTSPHATVLLDSVSPDGNRLTTLEVVMHRFVLAEFNTHRMFSRNSASSRAIPVKKQIERVKTDPAIPISFPAEQKGMVGGEALDYEQRGHAVMAWDDARFAAIRNAEIMHQIGVHKSVVNRILEPFMWHTVIVSATEWDGFWAQRCSPLAQPEMRAAAEAMRAAYNVSIPTPLNYGDWHLPYIHPEDWEWAATYVYDVLAGVKQLSAARCARVSYLTHAGARDPALDIELYTRLSTATPPHASPLEHVATPVQKRWDWHGNFTGYRQLRHEVFA